MTIYKYLTNKGYIMLLDNLFAAERQKQNEMVIVRKDGVLKHETRRVGDKVQPDTTTKVMFPISKERK